MKQHLNRDGAYFVIQDCLPGRTVANDDPENGSHFNGRTNLLASILAHSPIDHALLMLGTNSFKYRMNLSAARICDQLLEVASVILTSRAGAGTWHDSVSPAVTIICPPILGIRAGDPNWIGFSDWVGGAEKSRALRRLLIDASAINKFDYFDSNTVVVPSDRDPIHLSADNHHRLGEEMAKYILRIKNRQY
jgi:lysophospholipase L1-like esterase